MASLKTIRDSFKSTLAGTLSTIEIYDTVPGQLDPPCIVIQPEEIDFLQQYGSTRARWTFALIVVVGRVDEDEAQDDVDDYVSPDGASSVRAIIEADKTLGGAVEWAVPLGMSRYGEFVFAGVSYIGAQIDVEVAA